MKKLFARYLKNYPVSIFTFLTLFCVERTAQTTPAPTAAPTPSVEKYTKPKPTYTATKALKAPKIDGRRPAKQ